MREAVLEQRRFLSRRRYRLASEGVEVEEASPLRSQAYAIPYEAIGSSWFEVRSARQRWLALAAASFGVALAIASSPGIFGAGRSAAALAWVVGGLAMALRFHLTREHVLGLVGAQRPLVFLAGLPDAERLAHFLRDLGSRRVQRFQELLAMRRNPEAFLHHLEGLQLSGFLSAADLHEIERGWQGSHRAEPPGPVVVRAAGGEQTSRPAFGQYL